MNNPFKRESCDFLYERLLQHHNEHSHSMPIATCQAEVCSAYQGVIDEITKLREMRDQVRQALDAE